LTLQKPRRKSNGKVSTLPSTWYAQWQTARLAATTLREDAPAPPPDERLLQQVWLHQRLRRDALRTLDGHRLVVLHPGVWNREAGPDFRQAIIQLDDDPPRSGDVEIDLTPRCWQQHHHADDPAYRRVILHVVWESTATGTLARPTLALSDALDAPLPQLRLWFANAARLTPPAVEPGVCAAPLHQLDATQTQELLAQAAQTRLELKAAVLQARARQAGWTQALREGLFAALGYKHNVWPMRRLGELVLPLSQIAPSPATALTWQARLLGLGGLLPTDLTRLPPDGRAHVRRLWDEWWREQALFAGLALPAGLWRRHGLRPANQPQRRLALAAHWLADRDWAGRLEEWGAQDVPDQRLVGTLLARFQAGADVFWATHWTLAAPRLKQAQPLLGEPRLTDLAMNVVLPWFWSRAQTGGNRQIQTRMEHRFFAWPPGQDNATLRLARQRLAGGARLPLPRTAAMQQGLLQLARDFCDQSNVLCEDCEFPELVRGFGEQRP
jgi:hypothetical protein